MKRLVTLVELACEGVAIVCLSALLCAVGGLYVLFGDKTKEEIVIAALILVGVGVVARDWIIGAVVAGVWLALPTGLEKK